MANEEKELFKFVNNPKYRDKVIARIHKEKDNEYNRRIKQVESERDKLAKSRVNEITRISNARWEKYFGGKLLVNRTEGKIRINNAENLFSSIQGAELNMMNGCRVVTTDNSKSSDTYILECEKNTSTKAIGILLYKAILDFARRVSENKIPAGMSIDVFKSIQFISTHTNYPISVSDVADAIGKSTSLISKKFKRELGFNLSAFIMRRKLEEAKSLLAYSEKSISEISEYLCFSSQPYFQTTFKKQYGVTPYNYRKEHRHQ